MSHNFTKKLVAGGKEREFTFEKEGNEPHLQYKVCVKNDKGVNECFWMFKEELGQWKISANALFYCSWVDDVTFELSGAIIEEIGKVS